jgi:DNA-binding response OmpR family regulator
MADDALSLDEGPAPATRTRRFPPGVASKKILVVNDHVDVRSVITEFLRRRGLIAIPVRDAESARVICERVTMDLVLLHLGVLDLAEAALIRQVKLQRPPPRVIVISAVGSPELERECRALAIDEVVVKPIVLRRLERVISRLLRMSAAPSP